MLKKKKRTAGTLLAAFTLSTLVAGPALAVEGDPYDNVAQAWQDFNDGTIDSQEFWDIGMENFLAVYPDYFTSDAVTLRINGDKVITDEQIGEPYINENDRVMIPLRMVNSYLGYETDWQPDGSIRITGDGLDVELAIGSRDVTVNGDAQELACVPVLKQGRTYLPARDFASLTGSIQWNGDTRTVNIFPVADYDTTYRVTDEGVVRESDGEATLLAVNAPYESNDIDEIVSQKVIGNTTYLQVGMGGDETLRNVYAVFSDNGERLVYEFASGCDAPYYIDGGTIYYAEPQYDGPWTLLIRSNRLYVDSVVTDEPLGVYDLSYSVNHCVITKQNGEIGAITPEMEFVPFHVDELTPIPWPDYVGY